MAKKNRMEVKIGEKVYRGVEFDAQDFFGPFMGQTKTEEAIRNVILGLLGHLKNCNMMIFSLETPSKLLLLNEPELNRAIPGENLVDEVVRLVQKVQSVLQLQSTSPSSVPHICPQTGLQESIPSISVLRGEPPGL